ncbi:TcaA NTF2-like domain-containing protein [Staphylococcus intermedius]|uniref:Membrane-associated protein n=1 Tax=Staphylococcus intermedius NCTC 11048 TaxID=1141106 RepID=A0A380G4C5_STAIN|nr:teicoplanin resistance associated membrane protein TcaA [Staphylococcus intermedius]PCF63804.1 teicoplanin resistance protein VanZ [Staphylococcus intermedius]PCF78519.1 teicoplanin resistance protein VanZ [Staphylococcus intermedius]PCF79492.1 teicoplanin resistance protein VanZ [Staphylococcus intermedius]PCF86771.1 teicoplanin resistance protein VanZ [Staphylococcus intermedius]PCF89850.1 teicoplanin resistance protein VanZ [Staphylococcus intermedius]
MGQCAVCHHEKLQHHSVCPNCQNQILYSKIPNHQSAEQPDAAQSSSSNNNKRPPSLKKVIPIAIVSFIIILLIILFLLLRNFNSPEAQAKILINAVNNEDAAKVSNLLSSKENKVGRQEASTYIQYIKNEVGMKLFEKEVYDTVDGLNHETAVASYIKTREGQDVLRISKNGRRYLVFDNLSFLAPTKQAVVKPKEKATFEFDSDGSQKKVVAEAGQSVSLGQFIPGSYAIDTVKTTDRGTYEGQLKFDFVNSKNETIPVTEDFKSSQVKVSLKNANALDHIKVVINGEKIAQNKDDTYGPFPVNQDIQVYAEGEAYDHTFKTDTKVIKKDEVQSENNITVSFDKDEIEKYRETKEKETLSKIKDFFKKYTSSLNDAYKNRDFDLVSKYLKEDTTNYDAMRANVTSQNQQQFKDPEVTDVSRNDDYYSVTVEKEDAQGRTIHSQYLLDGDQSANHLKIVNYQNY